MQIEDRIRTLVQLSSHLEFVMSLGMFYNEIYRFDSREFDKKLCVDFNSFWTDELIRKVMNE